jgi:hypothetical protein
VERVIPIRSKDTDTFYKQYLTIIRPLLPVPIRDGELDVLAQLLKYNNMYRGLGPKERKVLIFDYDNVNRILNKLGISRSSFNNYMTSLRKKNYIIDNTIKESLVIFTNEDHSYTFEFKLEEDEG